MGKFALRDNLEERDDELLPPLRLNTDDNNPGCEFAKIGDNSKEGVGNRTSDVLLGVSLGAKYGDELEEGKLCRMDSSHWLCDAEVVIIRSYYEAKHTAHVHGNPSGHAVKVQHAADGAENGASDDEEVDPLIAVVPHRDHVETDVFNGDLSKCFAHVV